MKKNCWRIVSHALHTVKEHFLYPCFAASVSPRKMHGTRRSKNFKKSEKALSRRQVQALPSSLSFFSECRENMQKSLSFSMASPVLQLSHSVQCVVYMWQGPRKDRARILPRKRKGFPRHFSKQVSRDPEELTWNSQGGKGPAQRQLPRRYGSHPHDLRDPSL